MGDLLSSLPAEHAPALAVDPEGRIVVVWVGSTDAQSEVGLFVRRWDGTGWALVEKEPLQGKDWPGRTFEAPSVAITSRGEPLVVWAEHYDHARSPWAMIHTATIHRPYSGWWTDSIDVNGVGRDGAPVGPKVLVDGGGQRWIWWGPMKSGSGAETASSGTRR